MAVVARLDQLTPIFARLIVVFRLGRLGQGKTGTLKFGDVCLQTGDRLLGHFPDGDQIGDFGGLQCVIFDVAPLARIESSSFRKIGFTVGALWDPAFLRATFQSTRRPCLPKGAFRMPGAVMADFGGLGEG